MSIKDLFNKTGTPKIQKSVSTNDLVNQVESSDFIESKRKEFDKFVPPIDFSTASNFAKFGSAELYYEKAFERIHNYYPYDGTLHEKIEFENSSSYLDKYVFDNLYPRTNGYVNFNGTTQYITVFGGPHTASSGMSGKPLDSTFDLSMKYDESKKRTSAFEYRGSDGITTEFWFKAHDNTGTKNILHIIGDNKVHGEIRIEQHASNLKFYLQSGSSGVIHENFASIDSGDTDWNYYAVTVLSSSSGIELKGYKNGQLVSEKVTPGGSYNITEILPVTSLNAIIGAKSDGSNKLKGSLDEFRFWKTARTSEDIFNSWFIPLGGGTNNHEANIDLSCYFKFNEGITGVESLDEIALDYSGRINNGVISGYLPSMRNTGSAIRDKLGESEFLDPIIYSSHPDVISKKLEFKTSGSISDLENNSTILNYFPGWMQEEDEQNGKQLKFLSQIIGSYFDTLWHQINFINKIHDRHYIKDGDKALPFAKKLLYDRGFVIPDLFVEASKLEKFRQKDDNEVYEKQLNEVRNIIYHNLYNNLNTIYKSKGTEKSFRNFFRSLGIGQDVVKLKMYADDSTFVIRDNYELKSFDRKFVDFNSDNHFDGTIYQTTSSNNSNIYIPGDKNYTGSFTLQTEIILPRKQRRNESNYNPYPYLTASVAGYHHTGSSEYTHPTVPNGLQIYVVHSSSEAGLHPNDKQRIKFVLTGSDINLETEFFNNQYENNKWSLAARMKHLTYPTPNVSGSTLDDYLLEFYGVEANGNMERNSFLLTTSSVAHNYYSSDKIFYAGAHRLNFTGSTLHYSDVKLGYLRYWHSYLSNDAIRQHAFDSETFGANEPFEQDLINTYPVEIPREKTLSFHWAFQDVTSSNSSGEFDITDYSSGSLDSNYGPLSDTIQRTIAARAIGFNNSSSNIVDKTYLYSARKRLPDDLMSSDLTTIKTDNTEQFFVDEDVSDNFYSFEKSMWGTISDEMMNIFSTALDLNNLIGQPNQRYHHNYSLVDFLKNRFFEDVENDPDIEKFTSFYKWIDDSISVAVQQLVPASARFSQKINNIIESHVLERNKYVHQIPILTNFESTEGSIKGISELKYNWKFGHAPDNPDNEGDHVLWHKERRVKTGLRESLRISRNNHSLQSAGLLRRQIDGSTRISDTYAVRRFSKTYDFGIASQNTIHGGTNFGRKKNLQLFHESVAPAGTVGSVTSVPQNIVTIGVGAGTGLVQEPPNLDDTPRKKKLNFTALVGNKFGQEYGHTINSDFIVPMNVMSGTVNSGFNSQIEISFSSGVHIANLHNDVVGNYNEVSVQGPFTQQHVGGLQYRHIDLNLGTDDQESRPEGWSILLKDHNYLGPDADGALGFVGPDYENPYPSSVMQKANRYRDEHAKRPINVRNIKTLSGSQKVGNYKNELDLFQVSPTFQKTWAIEAYEDPSVNILPTSIAGTLPDSTQYQTLIGRDPNTVGNVFGTMNNNRQIDSSLGSPLSLAINSADTSTINHRLASDTTVSGYSTTGNKSISFWVNLDNSSTTQRYVFTIYNTSGGADALSVQFRSNRIDFFTRSTGGSKTFRWNVTMSNFVDTWSNVVIVWDGNQSSSPTLYINGSSEGTPDSTSGTGSGTTLSTMDGISIFDRLANNSTAQELQGSLMNLGIYEHAFISDNVEAIYNGGIVRGTPLTLGFSLIDFYYLGNDLSGLAIGDEIPNGTIVSSSFGSGNNHLTAQDGLVIARGLQTETRLDVDHIPLSESNVITVPRTDLTGSQRNILTRFSAPGGPEIQSIGYLDAYTSTYSVHNALPFRNSSVLGSGSGEQGTIRVEDHLGKRRGLKALRALHMGQFGIDSQYGSVVAADYPSSGSFNKQYRNRSRVYEYSSGELIITGSNHDNMHINTPIPRSEFQYSWINTAIPDPLDGNQHILGYAPRDGIVSSSIGYVEAIVFPSASSIVGTDPAVLE